MIKAIVFDLDNTLSDFIALKRGAIASAVDAMRDAGLPVDPEDAVKKIFALYDEVGWEDREILNKYLLRYFGRVDYKILGAGVNAYRRSRQAHLITYPHTYMTLIELIKRGIKLAIVSDAPRLQAWLRISYVGLHHFFDCVVTFDDTGRRKPDPAPFLKALDILGAAPQETLMVGDWPERDIAGAKALGMRTAFAKYGDSFGTRESGADFDLDDISDLIGIVDRENARSEARMVVKGMRDGIVALESDMGECEIPLCMLTPNIREGTVVRVRFDVDLRSGSGGKGE
ncbi:MAG: HAD-IA family hydrolase [bacterium]